MVKVNVIPGREPVWVERRYTKGKLPLTSPLFIDNSRKRDKYKFGLDGVRHVRVWTDRIPTWMPASAAIYTGGEPLCNFVELRLTPSSVEIEIDASSGVCSGYRVQVELVDGTETGPSYACGHDDAGEDGEAVSIASDTTRTDVCNIASTADCKVSIVTSDKVGAVECCNALMQQWSINPPQGYCSLLKSSGCDARCWRYDRECSADGCPLSDIRPKPLKSLALDKVKSITISASDVSPSLRKHMQDYQRQGARHPGLLQDAGLCDGVESTRGLVGCKTRMSGVSRGLLFGLATLFLLGIWSVVLWGV